MNSTLRDAQAPSHRECLLPSVVRTPSVTQVTPAKKITFLKRGDPRFAGVRLAVDQRVFKSFGALMDELSQRVPLSFGVRSVTTPRGLHGLSTLEQLEDGGCYLCSDKKPPKTPSRPGWPQGRSPSAQQSRDFESQCEAPGTSSSCKGPKAPRRIMLVKNGDPRFQQTVVLSHRNTRNLAAFLSKASDLLHFPVKQVYTTSGKKVDSLKGLLHSPSVLVCAGYESFKPLAMEDSRRYGMETLSGQTPRNKTGSWGPKAKQSVIHSRSRSGSRPRRFSLLSERSGLSDPPVSLHHTQMGPAPDRHRQDMPAQLGPLVASDDVEKKVRMNKDGSLSVEMKVRFHLLGEDALLWSRRVGRASALTAASEEVPVLREVDSLHCVWEDHPGGSSEPGAQGQGPCEAGCEEALGRGRWQPGTRYEIWMNPLYSTQGEGMASQRRSRLTQHSHSRRPCSQGFTSRKRSSKDSVSLASSDRAPKDSEPNSSCCSRSPDGSSGATGKAVKASRRGSSSCGPRSGRIFQGKKVAGGGQSLEGQERDGRMALGALPRASPDAVVREWLSSIPVEPVPMKCEMVSESTGVAGDDPEGPKEDPVDKRSPECLGEPTQVRQPSHEGATSEKAEPDGALPVTGDVHPKSEEGLPCSGVSEDPREAESGKGMAMDYSVGPCVLPHNVSASIQIMKALMGSKQGRPSSLPEVSSAAGRRLSRSAQALITCLAGLHFFDEDLGSPTGKVRFIDSPRYQELLSTFQALWPGCGLRRGEPDSGLWELGWCQALLGLRSDIMTEDFTPTSSSGVDVGSGSRGSGEGSGPCAMECALVPERVALPLKIPSQRPDSRTSENREDPGNQQLSGSTASSNSQAWACASRKDEAERNSGGQVLGRNLDQVVENTMQEEEVPLEKGGEEKEIAALQGDGVQGFPEEGRVMGQELSEANSQDGEGAQEDKNVQEGEAGRDPPSTILCPPGKREKPTELPRSLSDRDANASGPQMEPGLEKLPKAAETRHAQAQAKCIQGPGETSSSPARRVSLETDPLWVSRLLRKMEKAFMAHLGSATAELRARWSLQNNSLLDQMVAELQQDLGLRLRDSTEKELQEIWSQAAGKRPGPAREGLRWEMSLQMEQRRRRLQGLRYLSAFSRQAGSQGPGPFPVEEEDAPTLSGALGTWLVGEAEGEEFCPCEACMRKKVVPTSPKDTTGASRAPIQKAFDLQHILQKKKGGCASGETAEAAPEKRGMEPLQEVPLGTGTVQGSTGGLELGLDQDPGTEGWGEGENSQILGRDGDPQGGEEEATVQKREGSTGAGQGSVPEGAGGKEQGSGGKEENTEEGSGADTGLEGEASGGGDPSPGGQNDGIKTAEASEAEGEGQPESGGGNQGEEEGSPQVGWGQGQLGETFGNRSPDQEGKPALPPTPGGDSPCQRSGWKAGLASSGTSSLGNCSQLSQKGSVEKPLNGDMRSFEEESKGLPGPERKAT
ncbi:PREDICTED: retinitis pigmentosa 1-like 1 protein, partial [Odobenus rosmarus divergens]|uniref:Retinitis pigmentosa 1-like 1 protein n=1 Tax=Odobenus rosmarus divergens TaxID=9708 RepID=A0A9B0LIR9_ODORO